jgi:HlyD family secretion protein
MNAQSSLKLPNRWLVGTIIAGAVTVGGMTLYGITQFNHARESASQPVETVPPIRQVTALGRLEPASEVIQLAPPMPLDGDRLAELLVEEGDRVEAGQVIAILDSRNRLQNAVQEAEEEVRAAQARLAQVRSGAKSGEIQAQRETIARLQAEIEGTSAVQAATIARLQAEVHTAQTEYDRFQRLYQDGAISASSLDSKRLDATSAQAQLIEAQSNQNRSIETLQAQLREARATLEQIAEVRPVDVQTAQVEVDRAIAALKQAQTNLSETYIRAPIDAQILKIHTRPGEKLNENGIVELGRTEAMTVVAEVYNTDIDKVQVGQSAIVTGQAFQGELIGTVSQIGFQVSRQNVFSNQPGENLDRRVVEVRIALSPEASRRVARLTNMQVQVAIQE